MENVDLLNKVVQSISNNEHQIIDDFCKTFIAYQSIQGVAIEDVFKHYTLCSNPFGESTRRHWFEKKRDYEEEF